MKLTVFERTVVVIVSVNIPYHFFFWSVCPTPLMCLMVFLVVAHLVLPWKRIVNCHKVCF